MTEIAQQLFQLIRWNCQADRIAVITSMIERNPELLKAQLPNNMSPLLLAAELNDQALQSQLISLGTQPDLFTSLVLGDDQAVRAALETRPKLLQKRDGRGLSLLHAATREGRIDLVRYLLLAGLSPNIAHNEKRITPLHFSGNRPYLAAIELCRQGANPNAQDTNGFTPLHYAAHQGDHEWVDLLIANGANRHAQTRAKQTPWSLAVKAGHTALAENL